MAAAPPQATVGPPRGDTGVGSARPLPTVRDGSASGSQTSQRPCPVTPAGVWLGLSPATASDPPSTHHDLRRATGVSGNTGWLPRSQHPLRPALYSRSPRPDTTFRP